MFTFPSALLLTVVNVQSHLRARAGGSARSRACVGTPRGHGGWPVLREQGAARGGRGGPHSLFFALVSDSPFMLLPGCPGWGGPCSSEQRRATGGEGKAAGCPGGQGRVGWTGTGVAPGVRHDPVFGSPGEEFPPLHPCPAPPPTPPDQHIVPGARGTSWGP